HGAVLREEPMRLGARRASRRPCRVRCGMARTLLASVLSLSLAASILPSGCGGGGAIGDSCDQSGSVDECDSGGICGQTDTGQLICQRTCSSKDDCPAGTDCE